MEPVVGVRLQSVHVRPVAPRRSCRFLPRLRHRVVFRVNCNEQEQEHLSASRPHGHVSITPLSSNIITDERTPIHNGRKGFFSEFHAILSILYFPLSTTVYATQLLFARPKIHTLPGSNHDEIFGNSISYFHCQMTGTRNHHSNFSLYISERFASF